MTKQTDEREDRINKIKLLNEKGIKPYAGKFEKNQDIKEITEMPIDTVVQTAGRLVSLRNMGKITFAHLYDFSGKIQLVLKEGVIAKDQYKTFIKIINVGDFIGVKGKIYKTDKGEISILVETFEFLSKALKPLPDKWHGIKDEELIYRHRYLDLIMNEESRQRFKFRTDFIWELRKFYKENGFEEIDTPILCNTASGAMAKPFITHHNALDLDVYLRIAPEIYLKEAIIGGYEKIFEIARSFRNEGVSPGHLQDFTMVEHYCAYWDYKKNMDFTETMLTTIIKKLKGSLKVDIINQEGKKIQVDFKTPWQKVSFRELLIKNCGIDIDKFKEAADLRKEIKKKNIKLKDIDKLGRGNLIDALYKKVSRNKIVNPTFLTNHPIDLSPLARKNDDNPNIVDRFQLVINGWEVLNAYSELIDPIEQKERFEKQMVVKKSGDEEAMTKDDDYVKAMEYGMPPISGWGMGIDRIVALLTQQTNLKDVILFPLMRPENDDN